MALSMDILLSILALVAGALAYGAMRNWQRNRRQAVLMALAAAVMALNLVIWIWPNANGDSLLERQREGDLGSGE